MPETQPGTEAKLWAWLDRMDAADKPDAGVRRASNPATASRDIGLPATMPDGTPARLIPLHILTYWRGRAEEQANNAHAAAGITGGIARTADALRDMLERATAGMDALIDSNVLPQPEPLTVDLEQGARDLARIKALAAAEEAAAEAPPARTRRA